MDAKEWQVPDFEAREFDERRCRYCVAIFVINEGERLLAQLDRMSALTNSIDIVIADGGSTDGSVSDENIRPRGVNTRLVKTGPGKLGAQMRMAFAWALNRGYEGIVTIDGNNKDDPAAITSFVEALDDGYDHLQGSRFITGGRAENTPLNRLLGIRLLHAPLISLIARFRYTDTTNGFRAYARKPLVDSRVAPFREVFMSYELHYYLSIRIARLGYRVKEIPVTRAYPSKGPIPTKISPIRGNLTLLLTLMKACLCRYDPAEERDT